MSSPNACQELSCVAAALPDVAKQPNSEPQGTLNWVGMSEIELPVYIPTPTQPAIQVLARVQAYVNLIDPLSKGIHMSRLYLALDNYLGMSELTPALLKQVVGQFVESHQGLSDAAYLECRLDYYEKRRSLVTDNRGWKNYPVRIIASLRQGQFELELAVEVPYSSTCPCSAALARQLIQEGFEEQFGTAELVSARQVHDWLGTVQGIRATPHSQRSVAQVKVRLAPDTEQLPISALIDQLEAALQTPVQAAVKRADEQEFARLNASNLMFCEDAARRLKAKLQDNTAVVDFWIRVNHMESLHAHDAVAVVVKGVPQGYQDDPREYAQRA
ncbi:GTP cyclohydrolase FolE2 [Thiofilum flexile]|uniref:GTP cyclohydrolase FolE2 n=1 Tax=Thiofilum flexile TaxID=125627 RepID=UPI00036920D9|nr:GTP cyclohydrolase FolE2 [Thiofilum flexile]